MMVSKLVPRSLRLRIIDPIPTQRQLGGEDRDLLHDGISEYLLHLDREY
jgi:hypothetical protein